MIKNAKKNKNFSFKNCFLINENCVFAKKDD